MGTMSASLHCHSSGNDCYKAQVRINLNGQLSVCIGVGDRTKADDDDLDEHVSLYATAEDFLALLHQAKKDIIKAERVRLGKVAKGDREVMTHTEKADTNVHLRRYEVAGSKGVLFGALPECSKAWAQDARKGDSESFDLGFDAEGNEQPVVLIIRTA